MKCKICPVCNTQSMPESMICMSCLTPLDNVDIQECNENQQATQLKLSYEGHTLQLASNDIVGREALGSDILEDKLTVSRKHAKFVQKGNQWYVVDLGSTNKTYLNGEEIPANKEVLLHNNDELGLSRKVTFRVSL